jgi:ATP-dependent Clp protease adaptor protein ClpS
MAISAEAGGTAAIPARLRQRGAGRQNPGLEGRSGDLYDGDDRISARPWLQFTWVQLKRMLLASATAMTSTIKEDSSAEVWPVVCRVGVLCNVSSLSGAPRMADDDRKRKGDPGGPGTAVISKTKPQTKRPNMYRVLILNDDYTPMEFVVHVLERFFSRDHEAATRIMLHVHHHGIGECGIYTYEVAETKVTQVMDFARKHQHPLQCVMEKK